MEIIYTPLTMADREEFYQLAGNEKVAATMRFDCPHTQAESDAILADYLSDGNRSFALRFPGGDALWGVFAFKSTPGSDTADLSQMFVPEQWGRGYGNQVMHEMVELAGAKHWYRTLGAYILETNTASRRMVEKCGFREARRLRFPDLTEDLVIYQLTL